MDRLILRQVIADQREMVRKRDEGIPRIADMAFHTSSPQISVITGIRRAGKSTFMLQIGQRLENFHFITFDDERLIDFNVTDFNDLLIELEKDYHSKNLFLDEIQYVAGWERFARRAFDQGYKLYISGSNSRLLNSELATHLTGRYRKSELFPFSFREYLSLKGIDPSDPSTEGQGALRNAFEVYLADGGFPEYLVTSDKGYHGRIYNDIIYRDIIGRYGIRNVKGFRNLAQYLLTGIAKPVNYNAVARIVGLNSTTSVREYVSCLTESYLLFEVHRYDASLKRQYLWDKKIYTADNGLRNSVAFRTSPDSGRLLENLVFIELRRRQNEVWFYRNAGGTEVDFYIPAGTEKLIQVCYDMSDPATLEREKSALETAMKELGLRESYILTMAERREIKTGSGIIYVRPVYEWLLA